MGYVVGALLKLKPFYLLQYLTPSAWNPCVEKYNGPYIWHDDHFELEQEMNRNQRNEDYYNHLLVKIKE